MKKDIHINKEFKNAGAEGGSNIGQIGKNGRVCKLYVS